MPPGVLQGGRRASTKEEALLRNQSCSFSLDSPDLNYLTFLFLNFPCGEIEIEHPVFSLMRVKNLLMKGPVQILSLSVTSQTRVGRECWVPWQSRWDQQGKTG